MNVRPYQNRKKVKKISDNEKRVHDLAIAAAAASALKNFDSEVRGKDPAEKRASFADLVQDEYEYFLKYYQSKI